MEEGGAGGGAGGEVVDFFLVSVLRIFGCFCLVRSNN